MRWAFHPGFLEASPSEPASRLAHFQEAIWQTASHRSKRHLVVSELISWCGFCHIASFIVCF